MIAIVAFAALAAAAALALVGLLVCGALRKARGAKKSALALAGSLALLAGLALVTQWTAATPAIQGDRAVAQLTQVTLNGRKEWISARGHDGAKPVLLFLAGGPGGTQMAAVRHDLAALEAHFVVVNWDQPGSGKSYGSMPIGQITPDTYVEDGLALTRYLCETFGQQKIYLVGESWGSALGMMLLQRAPQLYHGFIGTGQMVSFLDTEIIDYALALSIAQARGDEQMAARLVENGAPPYYGGDVTWKSAAYLNYLSAYMAANPQIRNGGYNTMRDLAASEYGLLDKINFFRGIVHTFNRVYPQLYAVDLRNDIPQVEAPVAFFLGRHDVNAPTALAQAYFDALDAPAKELVWFEHSGHSPWINESDRFVEELLRVFAVP